MADQVEVNVDASTSTSVSHNSSFSFLDADVSGTSSLDTRFSVSRFFFLYIGLLGMSQLMRKLQLALRLILRDSPGSTA